MLLFIFSIFNSVINRFGIIIFELVGDVTIIYILIVVIAIIVFTICKKNNNKKYLLWLIFFVFLSYIFLLLPFNRGKRISELQRYGEKIVKVINDYKSVNNKYPTSIMDLYSFNKFDSDTNYIKKHVRYHFFDKTVLNKSTEEYYSLNIAEDFMDFEFLSYVAEDDKFILTDE